MRKTLIAAFAILSLSGTAFADGAAGAKVFKAKCASCHGADGKATTPQAQKQKVRDMTKPEWQKEFSDDQLLKATVDGFKREREGVKQDMPAYKGKLNDQQLKDVVAYMRSLKSA